MKTTYRITILCLVLNLFTLVIPQKASAQVSVNFQVFYDNLSPHGNWVSSPNYGYVWVPRVSQGFTPYNTNGNWVYTNVGWTWVSNYDWGWAPFHYGRWYLDPYYGWTWVPDTEWGPGWVSWRSSNDYYGWAPIGPGITINLAYGTPYSMPNNYWTFVDSNHFGQPNMNQYYVNNSNNVTIINNTTIINNIHRDKNRQIRYNKGPDRNDVQRKTGRTFTPAAIKSRTSPGQKVKGNAIELYRPQVVKSNGTRKPQPKKIAQKSDVKPQAVRNNKAVTPQNKVNKQPNSRVAPEKKQAPQKREVTPQKQKEQQPVRSNALEQERKQQQQQQQRQQEQTQRQQKEQQAQRQEQQVQQQRQQQQAERQQQQQRQQPQAQQPQQQRPPQQQQQRPPQQQPNRGGGNDKPNGR
ncbi:MAG: DUF6600 domain-containing protein [Bacteroidota bacterium]